MGEWWHRSLGDLADLDKHQVNPGDSPTRLFQHFSLPAFDAGQQPAVEFGARIESQKFSVPPTAILVSKLNPRIPRVWEPQVAEDYPAVASTEFLVLVPRTGTDRRFLKYLCLSPVFRSELAALVTGTSGSHQRVRPEDALAIEVDTPADEPEQQAIAHILGTLDYKIELNGRMNETLEAMARALHKSWFVDFDPIRAKAEGRDSGLPQPIADLFPDSFEDSDLGKIPRGWEVGALGDFLCQRVERCAASSDTAARPYVPIDCISPRSLFLTESKAGEEAKSSLTKFYKGDFLFGAMRPYFHKVCIAPFDGTTRTTAFVLYPRQASDFSFAALLLHHPNTIDFATRHSTGSTIPYAAWTDSLDTMPVIAPPLDVREAFDRLVRPVLVRIPEPYFENRTLAALRDTLLPKLISGELRVRSRGQLLDIASP